MCLCLVRRSGSTIAVRRRSHSSNRRVALTMFIWMVRHNNAGSAGCQWGRDRRVSPGAQLGRCHHEIAESSRGCVFLSSSQTKSAPASASHDIACMTTSAKTRKCQNEGSVSGGGNPNFLLRSASRSSPSFDAVKPISHHGEDGVVGRRLSASHEFFGGMAIALADTVTRLLDARNFARSEISGKVPTSPPWRAAG